MQILTGVTKDDELYFLEINKMTPKNIYGIKPREIEQEYFSMSGFTVKPLEYMEAVERSRKMLEDGEVWKMAVEAGQTELGLSEWVDFVLDTDGEISQIDNSLYPETITVRGKDYIFDSLACGQHEERDLKIYFLDKKIFHELMRIWDNNHLKKKNPTIPQIPFELRNEEGTRERIAEYIKYNK